MKINIIYIGLVLSLLSFSDCDFGVPSSITIGGSVSGYGPSGLPAGFAYDTLYNVDVGFDSVVQVNDTSILIKFNMKPQEDLLVLNINLSTRLVDPYISNGFYYWDGGGCTIKDFQFQGCYTNMNTYPGAENAHILNAVQDSIYNYCLNTFPFQHSGYKYQIEINAWVIKPSSRQNIKIINGKVEGAKLDDIAIGGKGKFYYHNP